MTSADSNKMRVLLIEDNPADARLILEYLSEVSDQHFEIIHVVTLAGGVARLDSDTIDVILLDLSLPDSQGFHSFEGIQHHTRDVPVVILSGRDDENLAVKAVQCGAQDYLYKGNADAHTLVRYMKHAVDRQRILNDMRSLSLMDELTALLNQDGFIAHGEQYLKLAEREKRGFVVLHASLVGLEGIQAKHGRRVAELAMIKIANILRFSFRQSDLVSHLGSGDFIVLAIDAAENGADILEKNLLKNLEAYKRDEILEYALSLATHCRSFAPSRDVLVDDLFEKVDRETNYP